MRSLPPTPGLCASRSALRLLFTRDVSFSGLAISIIRPTEQYYEPNGASCESKIRSRAARDNDNKKFSIIPGPFSLRPSAALPGAKGEHQYPGYLQFFTPGSIPPVFSLILHNGLMASPSGSETHTRPHPYVTGSLLLCSLPLGHWS